MNEENGLTAQEQEEGIEEEKKEESLDELLNRINNRDTGALEHKDFTVVSDIDKADYRYFFNYSALFQNKGILFLYLALPLGLSLTFALTNGGFQLGTFLIMALVLYVFLAGLLVLRTERKLAKIKKNSPLTLHTTRTTFTFAWDCIVHTKNEETIRIKYKTLKQVCKTKSRIILYFHSNKAMILHTADVEKVMPPQEFVAFLNSKITK